MGAARAAGAPRQRVVVEHAVEALAAELGRSPSAAELADVTGLTTEQVVAAREAALAYRCDSLDRPIHADEADGQATLADRIGISDEDLRRAEDGVLLDQLAAASLSARDRAVLRLRAAPPARTGETRECDPPGPAPRRAPRAATRLGQRSRRATQPVYGTCRRTRRPAPRPIADLTVGGVAAGRREDRIAAS